MDLRRNVTHPDTSLGWDLTCFYTLSRPSLLQETNTVLKRFGVGYEIKLESLKEDVFALQLAEEQSQAPVSMLDVGFGISQVLPIIVQSKLSRRNIILIEQPELHLHPRLQAELGTMFVDCISAPQHNQFIIETHSEHIILRLQRLIREGKLRSCDLSVIYVMKGEDGSTCFPLRIDEEGDFIDEWPDGFFEEGYREMFE